MYFSTAQIRARRDPAGINVVTTRADDGHCTDAWLVTGEAVCFTALPQGAVQPWGGVSLWLEEVLQDRRCGVPACHCSPPHTHAPELGASAQGWACSAHGESGGQNQLAIPAHPEDATLHETVTSSDQYKLAQLTGIWYHLPPRLCGESICPLAVMMQSKTKAEHTGCRNSISMKGNELTSDPNMTTLGNAKTLPCMCLLC